MLDSSISYCLMHRLSYSRSAVGSSEMARLARFMLTVETHLDLLDLPRAAMVFYPAEADGTLGKPQNGWGPNSLCMHAILRNLGFKDVLEFATPMHPGRSISGVPSRSPV